MSKTIICSVAASEFGKEEETNKELVWKSQFTDIRMQLFQGDENFKCT